jgi:hypothetical protein
VSTAAREIGYGWAGGVNAFVCALAPGWVGGWVGEGGLANQARSQRKTTQLPTTPRPAAAPHMRQSRRSQQAAVPTLQVDITKVPDFNTMYELYDPVTVTPSLCTCDSAVGADLRTT